MLLVSLKNVSINLFKSISVSSALNADPDVNASTLRTIMECTARNKHPCHVLQSETAADEAAVPARLSLYGC